MKKIFNSLFKVRRQEVVRQSSTTEVEKISIEEVIRRYEELTAK